MTEEKEKQEAEKQLQPTANADEQKGEELKKKEEEHKKKEAELEKREADLKDVGSKIKAEYEKRLESQKAEFESRLKDRDEIIEQLTNGEEKQPQPTFMEKLNHEREINNKKW